ncbi:MAG: hypothetical protein JNM56_26635 [Planctomycetia bacterium]|nr:hypothetical protein [Planctomycetia bacterium]
MTDAKLTATLQALLAREGRSLLQFMGDAFPWARFEEQEKLALLRKMIDDERDAAAALGAYLRRRRVPVLPLDPYPLSYSSLQFVALDYLLPQLVEQQRKGVEALQRDLAAIQQPDARQPLEHLLHVKQWHLTKLQELAAKPKAEHAAAAS